MPDLKEFVEKTVRRESETQTLLLAEREGLISRGGVRTVIQRRDDLRAGGAENALFVAVHEFEEGDLEVPKAVKEAEAPPTLDDVPKGTGPKEALVWLRRNNALSAEHTRTAARLIDQIGGARKFAENPIEGVRAVLERIGAHDAIGGTPGGVEGDEGGEGAPDVLVGLSALEFTKLDHRVAVSVIDRLPDTDPRLTGFFRAEAERDIDGKGPRPSVLRAFKARGLEEEGLTSEGDDEDPSEDGEEEAGTEGNGEDAEPEPEEKE